MSVIAWNVRGLNTPNKQFEVIKFLTKLRHSFVGLLENNKLDDTMMEKFQLKFQKKWKFLNNNDCNCKGEFLLLGIRSYGLFV